MMLFLCSLVAHFFVQEAEMSAHAAPSAIVIAGDSTAADYSAERRPQAGWGQALRYYMKDGSQLKNLAVNGRSTKSFIDEGMWQGLIDSLSGHELILISFGHNDSRDDAPERYAAPYGAYKDNLAMFIFDVRKEGGIPIIVSPAARRLWEGPAMVETHGLYRASAEAVARETGADFIDLSNLSLAYFEQIGREGTKRDFLWLTREDKAPRYPDGVEDNTHYTDLGACGVAYVVASRLMEHSDGQHFIDRGKLGTGATSGTRPDAVLACEAWMKANR